MRRCARPWRPYGRPSERSGTGLIDPDGRSFLALLARHDQVETFSGWIEEAGAGHLDRGDRLQRLVVVGVALPDDGEESGPAGGVEALVLRVVEQVVDVFRDGD